MSAEWVDMGMCPAGAPPTSGVNLAGAPDHYSSSVGSGCGGRNSLCRLVPKSGFLLAPLAPERYANRLTEPQNVTLRDEAGRRLD